MGRCPCFGSRKKEKEKNLNGREDEEEDVNNLKSVANESVSGRSLGAFLQYV